LADAQAATPYHRNLDCQAFDVFLRKMLAGSSHEQVAEIAAGLGIHAGDEAL